MPGPKITLDHPEQNLFEYAKSLASINTASFTDDGLRSLEQLVISAVAKLSADEALNSRLEETRENLGKIVQQAVVIARNKRKQDQERTYEIDAEAAARGGGAQGSQDFVFSSFTWLTVNDIFDALKKVCPLYPLC